MNDPSKASGTTIHRIRRRDHSDLLKASQNVRRKACFAPGITLRHFYCSELRGSRGAESRADFIHKLRIVLKELNETGIWLQMISKSSLLPAEEIVAIVAENAELSKIIAASVRTARGPGPKIENAC